MGYSITESISCVDTSTLLADAKAHAAKHDLDVTLQLGVASMGRITLNVSGQADKVVLFIESFTATQP